MTFIGIMASAVIYPQGLFASRFSAKQMEIAQFAYDKGKPHGFPQTMRAIAWQESSLGVNLENVAEGSCGIFGNRADIVRNRVSWKVLTTEDARQLLINDRDFAASMCIAELKFWQDRRKNWNDVIRSYNAGWCLENGDRYLKEIRSKMDYLRGR